MQLKRKHFIDFHKGINAAVILALILAYDATDNLIAWVYLALHGTYGLLWVAKSYFFGDKQWEQPASLGYGLYVWAGLSLYWVGPFLIVSGRAHPPGPIFVAVAVSIYTVGVFLHFASDMQKHVSLRLRPGQLFCEGLWRRLRNPNYFGELLIYISFGLLVMHWAPFAVLALFVATVWVPNMLHKDRSLSRYSSFAAWRAHSWCFIPLVW